MCLAVTGRLQGRTAKLLLERRISMRRALFDSFDILFVVE